MDRDFLIVSRVIEPVPDPGSREQRYPRARDVLAELQRISDEVPLDAVPDAIRPAAEALLALRSETGRRGDFWVRLEDAAVPLYRYLCERIAVERDAIVDQFEERCRNVTETFAAPYRNLCDGGCGLILPARSPHLRVTARPEDFIADHYCWPCAVTAFGPGGAVPAQWTSEGADRHEHGAGCLVART